MQAFANRLREEARGHSLVEIDLSCCSLSGEEGKVAVLAMLQHLPELDALAVSSNPGLGPHVAPILEHVLCNTRIFFGFLRGFPYGFFRGFFGVSCGVSYFFFLQGLFRVSLEVSLGFL